jgi:hypothetical protein
MFRTPLGKALKGGPVNEARQTEDSFLEVIRDLKNLTMFAHAISRELSGKPSAVASEFYASIIFAKIVMHSLTVARNTPRALKITHDDEGALWDVASICAIARSIIESHDALAYVAIHPVDERTRNIRIKAWELHDKERRARMLSFINSTSPELVRIEGDADIIRQELLASDQLNKSYKGKIRGHQCPDFLLTLEERNKASNINHAYYLGAKMFLSAYVHTHPISAHQLMDFRAGNPASLNFISLAVRYSVVFLAKAIEGMGFVFGNRIPRPDESVERVLDIWCGISASGVSRKG